MSLSEKTNKEIMQTVGLIMNSINAITPTKRRERLISHTLMMQNICSMFVSPSLRKDTANEYNQKIEKLYEFPEMYKINLAKLRYKPVEISEMTSEIRCSLVVDDIYKLNDYGETDIMKYFYLRNTFLHYLFNCTDSHLKAELVLKYNNALITGDSEIEINDLMIKGIHYIEAELM